VIVTLNGINVNSGGIDGLDKIKVKVRRKDEEQKLAKSFTGELIFYGNGFEIIRQELIDDPAGKFNQVAIKVFDDCCEGADPDEPILVFEGILRGDSIDWCEGECFVKAQAFEHTAETLKFDCVKSTLIYDNWNGIQQEAHPRMVYCNEMRPSGLQDVILIFGIILNIIFIAVTPVVFVVWLIVEILNVLIGVINGIIDAINTIPGIDINNINEVDIDGSADDNLLQVWADLIDQMNESILGCGREHPSPLVRRYIQNVCDKCGIAFESSILNDPESDYYNTVYLSAPVEKGTRDENQTWISENAPIKTLEGLLQDIKLPFSADYRIENGVLKFEREDFFWSGETFVSYQNIVAQGRLTEKVCYSWRDEDAAAFGRFQYSDDPVDWVGNEARDRYNDIVEFNQPYSELQSGAREIFMPYGMARTRTDGIDRDVLGDYSWWILWTSILQEFENAMVMNSGIAFQPKLLIWDGQSINAAQIKRFPTPGDDVPTDESFNSPYWFNENTLAPNTGYGQDYENGSLYARFHAWKHPRVLNDRGLEFTFAFKFNCSHLLNLDVFKLVDLPVGQGRIQEIEIDFETRLMTLSGKV